MLLQSSSLRLLLLLFKCSPIFAATTINFYSDSKCNSWSGVWDPIDPAWRTGCHKLEAPFPGSFNSSRVDSGCSVVFYTDSDCSSDAKRVPSDGTCIDRAQFLSYARPCGSESPPLPTSDSASAIHSTRIANSPEAVATSSSPASSSSQSASSSPSATSSGGGRNGGGLSTAGTIATSVILPSASIIVAIIFGIRTWNRGYYSRRRNAPVDIPLNDSLDGSTMHSSSSSAGGGILGAAASQEALWTSKKLDHN